MNEREKEELKDFNFEQKKENSSFVEKEELKEDKFDQEQKESLLRKIEEIKPIKEESYKDENKIENKTVDLLVKDSFKTGIEKTVNRAKNLGAYFVDALHDKIVNKKEK